MGEDQISNKLNEHDKRLHDGDLVLQRLESKIDAQGESLEGLATSVSQIHKSLHVDEGDSVSIQTRLAIMERIIKGILWVLGILVAALVTSVITGTVEHVMSLSALDKVPSSMRAMSQEVSK